MAGSPSALQTGGMRSDLFDQGNLEQQSQERFVLQNSQMPVSYTHLTLPTILRV